MTPCKKMSTERNKIPLNFIMRVILFEYENSHRPVLPLEPDSRSPIPLQDFSDIKMLTHLLHELRVFSVRDLCWRLCETMVVTSGWCLASLSGGRRRLIACTSAWSRCSPLWWDSGQEGRRSPRSDPRDWWNPLARSVLTFDFPVASKQFQLRTINEKIMIISIHFYTLSKKPSYEPPS